MIIINYLRNKFQTKSDNILSLLKMNLAFYNF